MRNCLKNHCMIQMEKSEQRRSFIFPVEYVINSINVTPLHYDTCAKIIKKKKIGSAQII